MSWFRKKSKSEEETVQDTNVEVVSETVEEKKLPEGKKITVEELFSSPYICSQNFLTLFQSVPEVFFQLTTSLLVSPVLTFSLRKLRTIVLFGLIRI